MTLANASKGALKVHGLASEQALCKKALYVAWKG